MNVSYSDCYMGVIPPQLISVAAKPALDMLKGGWNILASGSAARKQKAQLKALEAKRKVEHERLMQYMPYIAGGGGALLLTVILLRKRKKKNAQIVYVPKQ